jgi:hypothetical protein
VSDSVLTRYRRWNVLGKLYVNIWGVVADEGGVDEATSKRGTNSRDLEFVDSIDDFEKGN